MNQDETKVILGTLKVAYPSWAKDLTTQSAVAMVALWTEMFAEDPSALVTAAVKAFIASDTKGFPPSIGQVKEYILRITQPDEMTEMEAWQLLTKALSNSYYGAEKEFEKLPYAIQSVVGSPSQLRQWAVIEIDELQTVVQSNFMRSYRARSSSLREYEKLPESVKEISRQLASGFDLNRLLEGGR